MTPQQHADELLHEYQLVHSRRLRRQAELLAIAPRLVSGALANRHRSTSEDSSMRKLFQNFLRNESGSAAVEYGLVLGLVSVVSIAALTLIGTNLQVIFNSVATSLGAIGA